MSRSHKHTPIIGLAGDKSDKRDKQRAHRIERHRVRIALEAQSIEDILPLRREVTQVYLFAKDGKQWFDLKQWPTLMRK